MPLSDAEEALIAQAATLAHTRITPLAPTWERERRIGREVQALSLIHISEPTRPY